MGMANSGQQAMQINPIARRSVSIDRKCEGILNFWALEEATQEQDRHT
jgi:hypothetical protein